MYGSTDLSSINGRRSQLTNAWSDGWLAISFIFLVLPEPRYPYFQPCLALRRLYLQHESVSRNAFLFYIKFNIFYIRRGLCASVFRDVHFELTKLIYEPF